MRRVGMQGGAQFVPLHTARRPQGASDVPISHLPEKATILRIAFQAAMRGGQPLWRCSSASTAVSFSSTASRMKAERPLSPTMALRRASVAADQRIGTITVFSPVPPSGFRPMAGAVAAEISCAKSYIPACHFV